MADTNSKVARPKRLQWLYLIICLFGLYAIVPQLGSFRHSFNLIVHARPPYFIVALGFTALSYFAAAATYYILCRGKLKYGRTVLVQFAAMFVNRLLPAGIGGIGANYAYLRHSKLPAPGAAATVAINNVLGLVGHALLIVVLLLFIPAHMNSLHLPTINFRDAVVVGLVVVLLLMIMVTRKALRSKVSGSLLKFATQLASYRTHPARLVGGLGSSITLTLVNVMSFWMSSLAVHGHVGLTAIMLVFTFGIAVGTITPTPGGVGGIEAGLVTGLVAYHMSAAQALAAVLMYRLVSYWLALLVGAACFGVTRKRGYF